MECFDITLQGLELRSCLMDESNSNRLLYQFVPLLVKLCNQTLHSYSYLSLAPLHTNFMFTYLLFQKKKDLTLLNIFLSYTDYMSLESYKLTISASNLLSLYRFFFFSFLDFGRVLWFEIDEWEPCFNSSSLSCSIEMLS